LTIIGTDLPVEGHKAVRPPHPIGAFLSKPAVYGVFIPVVSLLNALVGILLPALMTPTVFGEYSLAMTLFQYGLIFDSGVGQLIDRWIPPALERGELEDAEFIGQRLLWVRWYIGVIVFAVVATALIVLAAMGELPFDLSIGLLSAFAGILYMIALGPGFIYRAYSARRNYAFAIGTLSIGLVVARPLGLIVGGLTGLFSALAIWYFAFTCFFSWKMPARLSLRTPYTQALTLVGRGLPFFATSFIWAFYLTANRWFASRLMDPTTFGHFAFSANIYSLLIGAVGGLNAFYYPKIVGRIASESRFALSGKITLDCGKLVVAIGGIVAVGIILTPTLLGVIYPQYVPSTDTVRILLTAVPAMILVSWLMPISLSAGRRPWIDGLIIYPAATIILYFATQMLARYFATNGIAVASVVSALFLVAMLLFQLRQTHILNTPSLVTLLGVTSAVTLGLCGLVRILP